MQQDKDRFLQMPEIFDKMVRYMLPKYAFLQESIFDIIRFEPGKKFTFVDLGAGSGIQVEKILSRYPESSAVYIDSSAPFMDIAKNRLLKYSDRVQYINATFESDWGSSLASEPALIISMSAIHHLAPEEKRRLYKYIYSLLGNNGWFFNIDEMRSSDETAYRNSMLFWYNYVIDAADTIPAELLVYYSGWMKHFEAWKKRNIDNIDIPKQKGDDLHETYEIQLDYLKQAGFNNSDLFIKYHLWCIIGGQK